MPKIEMRPYELSGAKYKLWYDVGQRLSFEAQSLVSNALCGGTHIIHKSNLGLGEEAIIRELARRRRVLIHFK